MRATTSGVAWQLQVVLRELQSNLRVAHCCLFSCGSTTTDIQRALHPPDKQDVAARLTLAAQRIAYGQPVVSRGPELLGTTMSSTGKLVVTFSNATLSVHAGILVPAKGGCPPGKNSAFLQKRGATLEPLSYSISGPKVTIECSAADGVVWVNADVASCFLYGPTDLPAPPIELPCGKASTPSLA